MKFHQVLAMLACIAALLLQVDDCIALMLMAIYFQQEARHE